MAEFPRLYQQKQWFIIGLFLIGLLGLFGLGCNRSHLATPVTTATTVTLVYPTKILKGHRLAVSALAFSHDSQILASGDGVTGTTTPGQVRLWSAQNWSLLRLLKDRTAGKINALAFFPGNKVVVVGSEGQGGWGDKIGQLKLWNVDTAQCVRTLQHGMMDSSPSIALSSDGQKLANAQWWMSGGGELCYGEGRARLWNAHTGELLHTLESLESPMPLYIKPPPLDAPQCINFSSDNKTLIGVYYSSIKSWSVATGKLLRSIKDKRLSLVCCFILR